MSLNSPLIYLKDSHSQKNQGRYNQNLYFIYKVPDFVVIFDETLTFSTAFQRIKLY